MSCTTKTLYKSIETCPGKKILPGIRRRLYFVNKTGIVTFPKLLELGDETATDMAKLAQL